MTIEYFFQALGIQTDQLRYGGADSTTDQLNSRYTPPIFVMFAILIMAKCFFMEPIHCWCPPHYTESMVDFTNAVCWTTNTYYLAPDIERIPDKDGEPPGRRVGYYQWVALILVCQATLFYLPRPIWGMVSKKSGISVASITDGALEFQRDRDPDKRDKTMRYMTKHLGKYLSNNATENRCDSLWDMMYGNYITVMYLVCKAMYVGNVIFQLFMLNFFLGANYHLYGFEVLKRMYTGGNWTTSDRFPRVTLCQFDIRILGNIHRYTVQCSLPMNLYHEMIFIFVWFWLIFLAVATMGSLCIWLFTTICTPYQRQFVRDRLRALADTPEDAEKITEGLVAIFVNKHLRRDGLFIVRLVSKNSSDLIAAELLRGLWDIFKGTLRGRAKSLVAHNALSELEEEGLTEMANDDSIT